MKKLLLLLVVFSLFSISLNAESLDIESKAYESGYYTWSTYTNDEGGSTNCDKGNSWDAGWRIFLGGDINGGCNNFNVDEVYVNYKNNTNQKYSAMVTMPDGTSHRGSEKSSGNMSKIEKPVQGGVHKFRAYFY